MGKKYKEKARYDVVIVGAGPAGASAAHSLVKEGYHVLLLEKKKLPRYKICTGLITDRSQDLMKQLYGPLPEEILCDPKTLKGTRVSMEQGTLMKLPMKKPMIYNVWRSDFDNWLIEQSGAEIWDEIQFIDFKQNKDGVQIKVKNRNKEIIEIEASYHIGADGGVSRTRKVLDPDFLKGKEWLKFIQVYCKATIDLEREYYYMFLSPSMMSFYTWLVFKDDLMVYGVACKGSNSVAPYVENSTAYLQKFFGLKIHEVVRRSGCVSPDMGINGNFLLGHGRVLLVGEAAGFLNVFGEGISSGLATGHAAALAIHRSQTLNKSVMPLYQELAAIEQRYTHDSYGMAEMITGRGFMDNGSFAA